MDLAVTMTSRSRGFTLIELMIAVAIVGLLAAIAFPSYQSYMRKSRRSDAFIALSQIQMAQERWRGSHIEYTNTLGATGLELPAFSERGFYGLAISNASTTGYVATATPTNPGPQLADTDCTPLTVTVSGALSPTYYGAVVANQPGIYYGPNEACWAR